LTRPARINTVTSPDAWYALPVLTGSLIRLEPLAIEHTAGYLAAAGTGADAVEVFRWLSPPPGSATRHPITLADAERHILAALAARAHGIRLAYAQIDAASGEFAGTTSYYEIAPAARAIAIGHTWLGRRWWRTGHNTESKLLVLTHAFDVLGAARVTWHTDIHNERSQAAIERLGAQREGVLRKHRIRWDGSWRDTVQYAMTDDDWPAVRVRLRARLERGATG
jgi:RimJ/RimL family protein N-acetyltransferase